MSLYNISVGLCYGSELLLLSILLYRKRYYLFPILTSYLIYLVISDPIVGVCYNRISGSNYERLFAFTAVLDYVCQTGILLEVIGVIVKPLRPHLPRLITAGVCGLMCLAGLVAIVVTRGHKYFPLSSLGEVFVRSNVAFAVFRVVALALAIILIVSLGVGWERHAARVATGLSIYALSALVVEFIRELARLNVGKLDYFTWEPLSTVGWALSLSYISFYCYRPDPPISKFQMCPAQLIDAVRSEVKACSTGLVDWRRL